MVGNSEIIFGIVTFREEFWRCTSFLSLLKSYRKVQESEIITIYIFDNTDSDSWFDAYPVFDDRIKIVYYRDKSNPGISVAYNHIASYSLNNKMRYIVYLDQDSDLPIGSYSAYLNFSKTNEDVGVPKVFSQQQLISPSKYICYRSFLYNDLISEKIIIKGNSFINSGLMIKTNIFFKAGSYNEKLRLDFCDHDFTQRLQKITKEVFLLPFILRQNFSATTNTLEQAKFRYEMFEKDISSFKEDRNEFLITLLVDIPHLLKLTLKFETLAFFKIKFGI